jgi:general secretion pathway protein B
MSSILDALKKSERQRSLGRDLIFRNVSPDAPVRLTGFALAVLVVLALLVVAFIALLLNLREAKPPLATTTSLPTQTSASIESETSSAGTITPPMVDTLSATPAETPLPLDSQIRSNSESTTPLNKSVKTRPSKSETLPHVPPSSAPVKNSADIPWLSSLPEAFRLSLPPLSVNIHVYSPDVSQRILYINNRQAQQGERIEGGVLVVEIVEDGVVLQYHGQRFKLPRPS